MDRAFVSPVWFANGTVGCQLSKSRVKCFLVYSPFEASYQKALDMLLYPRSTSVSGSGQ